MNEELSFAIVTILCFLGWMLMVAVITQLPTDLPNDCILYEGTIWCEEVESE